MTRTLIEFRKGARRVLAAYPYLATDWRFGTLIADLAAVEPLPQSPQLDVLRQALSDLADSATRGATGRGLGIEREMARINNSYAAGLDALKELETVDQGAPVAV